VLEKETSWSEFRLREAKRAKWAKKPKGRTDEGIAKLSTA
jgi:hypothetical protein